MNLCSTRNKSLRVNFSEAVASGLASDGGLFYPIDSIDLRRVLESDPPSFQDFAFTVLSELLAGECTSEDLEAIAHEAFYFSPDMFTIHERISLLDLSTGKTAAFKDYGASFLASWMSRFQSDPVVILTATSGDTGSAVAQAFYNKRNISVVVLFPEGKISQIQERQMTTLGDNIDCLAVNGSFDDCQAMVKACFADDQLRDSIHISSANSINIGRLIPQSLYYLYARKRIEGDIRFCVPSGNFGNMVAAMFARQWGMDCDPFLAACNENDTIPSFLSSDTYAAKPSIETYATAMDVGNPSNFERFMFLCEQRSISPQKLVSAISVTDDQILETIRRYYEMYGQFVCPHTATGLYYAEQELDKGLEGHVVCVSTAHAGKFRETVHKACGHTPDLPPQLQGLEDKPTHKKNIDANIEQFKQHLRKRYG